MSNDDPFGRDGSGGDWGTPDENIDMNYGQPLSPPGGQPSQPGPLMGQPQQQQQLVSSKPQLTNDDIVALVLSAFFPGVGHMILGQSMKGIAILVVSIFTCGGLGIGWILVLVDAYLVAMTRKYRPLGDWEFFPDSKQHFKS